MQARLRSILPPVLLALGVSAPAILAHNNPSFREELFQAVEVGDRPVTAGAAEPTAPFALSPPRRTVELVWRVDAPAKDTITFAVAQGDETVVDGIRDGTVSRLLRGDGFAIVDVNGAAARFTVRIYANVIDRSREGAAAGRAQAVLPGPGRDAGRARATADRRRTSMRFRHPGAYGRGGR